MRALAPLRVDVALGSVRLDGSLLAAPTEASLRSAATLEVEVLLQGDMWAAGVGDDHPATAALLAGLRSAQDEPAGWNAAVLPALCGFIGGILGGVISDLLLRRGFP